jgi:hypothetical protein
MTRPWREVTEILAARILTADAYTQARLFDGVSSPWLRDRPA